MDEAQGPAEPQAQAAAVLPVAAPVPDKPPAKPPTRKPRRAHGGLRGRLLFVAVVITLIVGGYGLLGKALPLPVWVVAEVEARLNRALAPSLPDAALALGAVDLTLGKDGVPRLRLDDVRLLQPDGSALLTLPEVFITLQGRPLLSGEARVTALRISGAQLAITRDIDGRFNIALGGTGFSPQITRFSDLFDLADAALAAPGFAELTRIEAEALTVTLNDQRLGRTFALGDGRLTLENQPGALAAVLAVSVQGQGPLPGRAVLQLISEKGASTARISAQFNDIAAADVAAQAPVLAPLASLDAPISGNLSLALSDAGLTALTGELEIGKGALRPTAAAGPVAFDRAKIAMAYDATNGQVRLTQMEVESATLRARATGHAYLMAADGSRMTGPLTGALPAAFVTQIAFDQVMIDPEGMFTEPVRFSSGAFDFRLKLDPFVMDIGQLSLAEDQRRMTVAGRVAAGPNGWTTTLDLSLNEIAHDRLLALWPKALLTKTREWVGNNLLQATLFDLKAALRIAPGAEPRLHLGYSFRQAEVRFMPSLPPIEGGEGYSTVDGRTYNMVLSRGQINAPQGGLIDMAGSVFAVPDVAQKPAIADIRLVTRSSLTAALSLLDLPPFHFMTKADRPVDLGDGRAEITTRLQLPLQGKIGFKDISYEVAGRVSDFSSLKLVPKRVITAKTLAVSASPAGLSISGSGQIGKVPFDVLYSQSFAPDQKGRARIEGDVTLSQAVTEEFGLGLPAGMVTGSGAAQVEIDLTKGAPGRLRLTSGLENIGIAIPEIGWRKPAGAKGRLEADVVLGPVPEVARLMIDAAGLAAEGKVTLKPDGGLDVARFERVTLDDWLDATVELQGRGAGKPVGIAVRGGSVDIRHIPGQDRRGTGPNGQAGGPLNLSLDRLILSSTMALTDFNGTFRLRGGFDGDFTARMNGGTPLRGAAVPGKNGTAVRILSEDAGGFLANAGVFAAGRGGNLDLTLTPRPTPGQYDGRLAASNLRVRNASVLAELLNAISVVGVLDQLNGQGLLFQTVEGDFVLSPGSVQVRRGSAVGASLGVSLAGVYQSANGTLNMQGVISPVYLLNGVGAFLTRRGEGVFGFNYELRGTADNPDVSVNPLSIFTPGMFRNMFRRATP